MATNNPYARKILGIESFKYDMLFKKFLYKTLGITFPKLKDQRDYWNDRGAYYQETFCQYGFLDRENFFQDLLFEQLKELDFSSCFEAGCGFGWNIRRAKEAFPHARVGGLDFSHGQLKNAQTYMKGHDIQIAIGDNRKMPFADNAFDVGFSVGVFMNIHPDYIKMAIGEMIRVSRKYILHLEYDENHTTPELKKARAIKTNVISHDYKELYEDLGQNVRTFLTHKDFGERFEEHMARVDKEYEIWQPFEGPGKYTLIVVEVDAEATRDAA